MIIRKMPFLFKLVILGMLVTSSVLDAQSWFQPDYRWSIAVNGGWNIPYDYDVVFGGDTTIHNLPCKKWIWQNHFWQIPSPRYT